jgi:Holliday junction resolvasome RuvABC endonuclease subunit
VLRTTDCFLIIEELVKVDVPKLGKSSTIKQVLDNVDLFTEQLDNLKNKFSQKYKFNNTMIEDCYMGFNPKTTKMLAYNGILTYDRMKRISNNTTLIMPTSARKLVNFQKMNKTSTGHQLKKEIVHYINVGLELKLKIKDNDKADAIVLALAGLIK